VAIYTIKNRFYGRNLVGRQVHYRGFKKKPPFLKAKGQGFPGGKHLLETLDKKFKKYDLVLHPTKNGITKKGRRYEVVISEKTLKKIEGIVRDRNRDIRLDAAVQVLSTTFSGHFARTDRIETYRRGVLAKLLTDHLDPRSLSAEDARALTAYAAKLAADPKAAGFDERETVKRKRGVQLLYLKRLLAEFDDRLKRKLPEKDWQSYFDEKILYLQDSYIRKLPKINVATVTTQFPDFGVVTADDYLDLTEIKLPSTPLLLEDASHNTFYWSSDVSKAIAQVESYIESVTSRKADLILQIEKVTGLRLKIVKPRGIIIAGSTSEFSETPAKADFFRMLNEGLKNIEIVPYDEVARRLRNTIISIEKLEQDVSKT
jgi:hypothetical protein